MEFRFPHTPPPPTGWSQLKWKSQKLQHHDDHFHPLQAERIGLQVGGGIERERERERKRERERERERERKREREEEYSLLYQRGI
jgi:hypothetical protein